MSQLLVLRRGRRRVLTAALLTAAAWSAGAPAAGAADAPMRAIAFDASGAPSTQFIPVAVRADGAEVAGYIDTGDGNGAPFIRNVATGTTEAIPVDGRVVDASTDLRTLLIASTRQLDPLDTGTWDQDFYVYDRDTRALTLVSRDAAGHPAVAGTSTTALEGNLSGNGRVVTFRAHHVASGTGATTDDQWRWERGSATLTQTATGTSGQVFGETTDDTGSVTVDGKAVQSGTRRTPLPTPADYATFVAVSPDGTAAGLATTSAIAVVRPSDGAVTKYTLPTTLLRSGFRLWATANGGGSVVVGQTLTRTTGPRYVLSRLTPAGALTQLGADIPVTAASTVTAVAPNLAWAATNSHLAQLGTTPIPGTPPTTPSTAQATDYLQFRDVSCTNNIVSITWNRASIKLASYAVGADLRVPKTASVRVFNTSTGATINAFTLTAGQLRELTVARTGGYTYAATVTFTDGSTLAAQVAVPTHAVPTCPLIL